MTPEQKRRRMAEIQSDINQIMMQLHEIEYKVDRNLVDRRELPRLPQFPSTPQLPHVSSFFRSLWIGFTQELKTQKKDPQ